MPGGYQGGTQDPVHGLDPVYGPVYGPLYVPVRVHLPPLTGPLRYPVTAPLWEVSVRRALGLYDGPGRCQ